MGIHAAVRLKENKDRSHSVEICLLIPSANFPESEETYSSVI